MAQSKKQTKKKRLDVLLLERGLCPTRSKAQAVIMSGAVLVSGRRVDKPGSRFPKDVPITLQQNACPYVSRGGIKLQHALEHFDIDVEGRICMDVGASTGGFTHCLLTHGAKCVYAVDVGYGQLDWGLRNHPRVKVMEKTNFRYLSPEDIGIPMDVVTIDVSFISLKLILPVAMEHLVSGGIIIALVKPQFEVGPDKVGKGGIVRDQELHKSVLDNIISFAVDNLGLKALGNIESPIRGAKGNREFLLVLKRPG